MIDKRNFYINGNWVHPNISNDYEVINPSNEQSYALISLGTNKKSPVFSCVMSNSP